ncbi:MAG: RES family NAD+ phosphorylase [Acidobacteriaceae bacterium]|jgi:RES domain-containing protein
MLLWRISLYPALSGIGAEMESGRWHTAIPAKRLVYLAEHPAVALLENLVNLDADPQFLPDTFQLLKISTTGPAVPVARLTPKQVATIRPDDLTTTQSLGDAWLAARTSALLRVPSIPSPESWNYLLNPLHSAAARIKVDWARRITYDKRLFHLAEPHA